jgi:hypothetical protein
MKARFIVLAAALALAPIAGGGSALAEKGGNENGNGVAAGETPGNSANAPGQEKKAEVSAQKSQAAPGKAPAAAGKVKKAPAAAAVAKHAAKSQSKPAAGRQSKPAPSVHSTSPGSLPSGKAPGWTRPLPSGSTLPNGDAKTAHHKVTICHATGSSTNPYVIVTVSINAWQKRDGTPNGHGRHGDDILLTNPATAASAKLDKSMCAGGAAGTSGDVAGEAATGSSASDVGPTGPGGAAALAGEAESPAGGVAGEQAAFGTAPAEASQPQGGVLGAAAVLGQAVKGGTLPFTGFPLWLALVVAIALLSGGVLLRRRGRTAAL